MFFANDLTDLLSLGWDRYGVLGLLWMLSLAALYWLLGRRLDQSDQKLEREFDSLGKQDEIRFSTLHSKRVEKIDGIYSRLVDLRHAAYKENPSEFQKQILDSFDYAVKARIYMSRKLADDIQAFFRVFEVLAEIKFTELHMKGVSGLEREWQKLINQRQEIFGVKLPVLFDELESEARKLINVED